MWGSGRSSAGRAAKRARSLSEGGSIALTGSFGGTSAHCLTIEEARDWLGGLDGPVLFVHDDVTFEMSHVEALRTAHLTSGRLALATIHEGPPTRAIDIPIAVGLPDSVCYLLPDLHSRVGPAIELVDCMGLSHAGDCESQVAPPLLVASMIVRDERDLIAACLESLQGLVDRIEIVDTGSVDDTIDIARAYGAHITTAEWCDDFAAARNLALDQARDARFVLQVDADERVTTTDAATFREALASTGLRAVRVPMRNIVDGKVTSEFEAVRVFSTEGARWVGRVHEYPADDSGTPLPAGHLDGLGIDHIGYQPEMVAGKNKWDRNVALAEAAYRESPSFKTRLDLARSLAWRSDDERAFEIFREAAADLTGASDQAAAFVIAHVALAEQIGGDLDRAHATALRAIEHCSGEYVAHLARARAWRVQGNDEAIVAAHAERSSQHLQPPMFDTAATRRMTDDLTVGALARIGQQVDAIELAVSVLDQDPTRFTEWKSLAGMPHEMRRTALPLLTSMDTTGSFVDALAGEVSMPELAALVLANVEAQRPTGHTVITGIMAAVLAGDEVTATRIAELAADTLDPDQRAATAERCRMRHATTVAAVLDPVAWAP